MEKSDENYSVFHSVAYPIFLAFLFIFLNGYQFNTADQAEHLPQVYKLIDPLLYPSDDFVNASINTITIRDFFVNFLYYLNLVIPLNLACFLLTILSIALSAYAFMKITVLMGGSKLAVYLTPFLVLVVFYKFTIGGNHIQYPSLICSTLAKGFAALAIVFFLKNQFTRMAALLGVAALFQLMVGFQLFLILMAVIVLTPTQNKLKSLFITSFVFFIISGPILFPVVFKQIFGTEPYNKELYNLIQYYYRNPTHFIPSLFPVSHYVRFAILLIPSFFIFLKYHTNHKVKTGTFALVCLTGLVLYVLLIEIMGVQDIAKSQWFKTTIWINLLCCIQISIWGGLWVKKVFTNFNPEKVIEKIYFPVTFLLAMPVLFSAYMPFHIEQEKFMIGKFNKSDLTRMHEWISVNIPKEKVVLVSPDNYSFSCQAKRSQPVNFKAIVHEPKFMIPWYEKFSEIYGVTLNDIKTEHAIKIAIRNYRNQEFIDGDMKYNIDYRIDDLSTCHFKILPESVIHQEGEYVLSYFRYEPTR